MTSSEIPYDPEYYSEFADKSRSSARAAFELVRQYHIFDSVVDVGCGQGFWLREFFDLGAVNILGLDGPWVRPNDLLIPQESFVPTDLNKPIQRSERYDLALCMEVAEHLPPSAAKTIVSSLTGLADVVLFSASIPYQPGDLHQNCQWPEYWAALFAEHGYLPCDCIRSGLWDHPGVTVHYKNNTILYVNKNVLPQLPARDRLQATVKVPPPRLVHPDMYISVAGTMSAYIDAQQTLSWSWRTFSRNLIRKITGRKRKYEIIPDLPELMGRTSSRG
jgi:hypothetical protein